LMSDPIPGAALMRSTGTLYKVKYEIRPNTHRHVHLESSIDERRFSGAFL
jgi:hypothetical protein